MSNYTMKNIDITYTIKCHGEEVVVRGTDDELTEIFYLDFEGDKTGSMTLAETTIEDLIVALQSRLGDLQRQRGQ